MVKNGKVVLCLCYAACFYLSGKLYNARPEGMNLKAILVGMNLVWWPRDGGRQDSCSQTSTDCAANRQRVSKHGNDALIWRVQENRNHLLVNHKPAAEKERERKKRGTKPQKRIIECFAQSAITIATKFIALAYRAEHTGRNEKPCCHARVAAPIRSLAYG